MYDEDGSVIDLAASTHQATLRIVDPRSYQKDLLYLNKTTGGQGFPWFFHGAIGIWPPQIYLYPKFPEQGDYFGKFPETTLIRPSQGDRLGYLGHRQSPKDEPTDFLEIVIPPLYHFGVELYNHDTDKAHQPVLGLDFKLYFCQLFKPEKHGDIIADMANDRKKCRFLNVGFGEISFNWDKQYGEDWGIDPIPLEEAMDLSTSSYEGGSY